MVWSGISHLNGFEILILFYIVYDRISEDQIKIRFSIELHGKSKLSMTSVTGADPRMVRIDPPPFDR